VTNEQIEKLIARFETYSGAARDRALYYRDEFEQGVAHAYRMAAEMLEEASKETP
jgi:hypothetical protein